MRPAAHVVASAQSIARRPLLPCPSTRRDFSRTSPCLGALRAAMNCERAISCDREGTDSLCAAQWSRRFSLQSLHLSSALFRGMKAAQLAAARTAHEVSVDMEKEKYMHRTNPHLPAWRARLTAAA